MNAWNIEAFGASDRGRLRADNEDAWLINDRHALYAVADGMGGQNGGGLASRLAVARVDRYLTRWCFDESPTVLPGGASPCAFLLARAVQEANNDIVRIREQEERLQKMGTTFTSLMFTDEYVSLCHIGDSRAYRIRNNAMEQLTEDHTFVNDLVKMGRLTPDQAAISPFRHCLNRFLGREFGVPVDLETIDICPNDIFVLCSDGLCNLVEEHEILEAIQTTPHTEVAPQLIDLANARGGYDNITVVVVPVEAA